jgi:phosphatidylglycerol lysyltransferase
VKRTGQRALGLIRRHPATLVILVALIAVWVIAIPTGPEGPFSPPAAGLNAENLAHQRWWVLFTSLVAAGGVVQFVISVVAAVVGVGLAERWMGWWRTLIAFVVTGVLAGGLGLGLELLGSTVGEFWSSAVRGIFTLDPLTPIAGTLAWATAWAAPVERRRARTLLVGFGATLLLYSGQPADLYLLVAVGLGIGFGALSRRQRPARWPATRHETRSLLAIVTVLLAVGPLLTLLSVDRYGLLSPLGIALTNPSPPTSGQHCVAGDIAPDCLGQLTRYPAHTLSDALISLLPLVLFIIGARGLQRGRRAAVWLLVALSVVQSGASAWYYGVVPVSGDPYTVPLAPQRYWEVSLWLVVSTLVPLAYAILLILRRRAFPVQMTRSGAIGAVGAILVSFVVPATAFVVVAHAIRRQFSGATSWGDLIAQAPQRFVPGSFLRHEHITLHAETPLAHAVMQLPGVVFWLGVVATAAVVLLRRSYVGTPLAVDPRLRTLLQAGSGSLGHLATWAGNRLWVSDDGAAGIAYQLQDGMAVTVSDPFGRIPDRAAVVAEFLAFCDGHAWTPVFYSVHEEWRAVLADRGWRSLPVAEEMSLDPAEFSLSGKAMNDVRTAINKAQRLGMSVVTGSWDELPAPIRRQVVAISDHWVAEKSLPEMGFTLGGLDELDDPEVSMVVAQDADEKVIAITSWLPVWRDGEIVGRTLDFMRRAPESPNGAMEYTIARAFEEHKNAGIERSSLSATPLARTGETRGGPLDSVLSLVGRLLEPVYGFKSLLKFKTKFKPTADAMHLVFRDPVQLPAIGIAIARCYLPDVTLRDSMRLLRR